jgi:eukaryotic-like serine/threonine-protein kinase
MGFEREAARDGPMVAGRYALYDKIATGGMATVHLGRLLGPIGFSRTVAIKRMLPQFVSDLAFVSMFVDEARLASRVRHPNVVPTLDVVAQKNELFLVLEYVHGETLSQLIKTVSARNEKIPRGVAAAIVCGLLHGLHAAHNVKNERGKPLGLVHRDVSPQNVLVGTDGVARLLDFGVAKAAGRMQVTSNGEVKGKLAYMAPEQVKGTVTPQSDVYSAAAVLWEALTCERLFHNVTWTNIAQVILHREVEPPNSLVPDLSPELNAIVLRGLEKDPRKRFATAREMALAIEACVPLAPAHEVGEWVERTAEPILSERAQKIAEIESRSSEAKMAAASMALVQGPARAVDPDWDGVATKPDQVPSPRNSQITLKEEATDGTPGTQLTQVSSQERLPVQRRSRWVAGVVALLAIAFGGGGWLLSKHHTHAVSIPRVPEPPPIAEISPPPIVPTNGPSSSLPATEETSSAAASATPHSVSKRTSVVPSPKRTSCNPPYVVDENHIRHIKPQCL